MTLAAGGGIRSHAARTSREPLTGKFTKKGAVGGEWGLRAGAMLPWRAAFIGAAQGAKQMAARTIRVFWPDRTTGWVNVNWAGVISDESVVHVAVCEGRLQQLIGDPLQAISRFRGDATMYAKNVHPHTDNGGGVEFFIQIDWSGPLNVVTDITVLDTAEVGRA